MASVEREGEDSYPSSGISWRELVESPVEWLFVTGNRLVIAGMILVLIFGVLVITDVAVGTVGQEDLSPQFYLFSALVGGNFTLITIVISVSQLVISQQLGTPGSIRDQIEETNQFRKSIEESVDVDVAPATPTEFLYLLLRSAADFTRDLERERDPGDPAWTELHEAVEELERHIGGVARRFDRSDASLLSALAVTLETNYSADIYRLRRLRTKHADEYDDDVLEYIDSLVLRLQQIDVGRQYLKTVYMQDELARLSRHLFYVGLPAVLASGLMLRTTGAGFGVFTGPQIDLIVPVVVTVGLAPLVVLFVYILRITGVSNRTIAITPFTMATGERDDLLLSEDDVRVDGPPVDDRDVADGDGQE